MCSILLSINPCHVKNIFNGQKEYEYRKIACKRHVDKILIYSTNPVMKVVGEAEVEDVLIDQPDQLWNRTANKSGIDKVFYDRYYEGRKFAVAYKLTNVVQYEEPRTLEEYGIGSAPQSFQYVENF